MRIEDYHSDYGRVLVKNRANQMDVDQRYLGVWENAGANDWIAFKFLPKFNNPMWRSCAEEAPVKDGEACLCYDGDQAHWGVWSAERRAFVTRFSCIPSLAWMTRDDAENNDFSNFMDAI